jgi:hypothetical protein
MRQHNVDCITTAKADVPKLKRTVPWMTDNGQGQQHGRRTYAIVTEGIYAHCGGNESTLWPVDKVGHFVSGMARTTKEAFTSQLTGAP